MATVEKKGIDSNFCRGQTTCWWQTRNSCLGKMGAIP